MAIPAAKVKSVCSASEAALVRASRRGEIEQLSPTRLKQLAGRAKKLTDKWKDLSRSRSRTLGRSLGTADAEANTLLKAQIFEEALKNFEARLAKVAEPSTKAGQSVAPKRTTKKARAIEHRAKRAGTRKELAAKQVKLNASPRKKSK
jgi:hypothetical protein